MFSKLQGSSLCGLGNSSSKEREFFKDVIDAKMFRLDEVAEGVMVGPRDDYGTIIFINVNVDPHIIHTRFAVLDIDECNDGTHECNMNADCHNIIGSYKCTCKDGLRGNGIDSTQSKYLLPL